MKWWMGALGILSLETIRAENKILESMTNSPSYRVSGPLVSVIIPAYNEEKYISATLTALLNQTYSPIEVIVVDNISEDDTVQVSENFGATVLVNTVPANVNMSRNIGARASNGYYLIFIDADTIPESRAVEESVHALQNGMDMIFLNKISTTNHFFSMIRTLLGWLDPAEFSAGGAYIATTRDVFDSVGGWDESLNPLTGEGGEDGRVFTRHIKSAGFRVGMLKTIYVGTSDRRRLGEGLLHLRSPWATRAIRQYKM